MAITTKTVSNNGNAQPRVIYILPQPFFALRGSSFRAKATVETLAKLGFGVDLVCLNMGNDLSIPGVTIHRVNKLKVIKQIPIGPSLRKIVLDIFLYRKAKKLIESNVYCVIHGVEEGGLIAHYLSGQYNIPFIFDMHSCMSEQIADTHFGRWPFVYKVLHHFEKKAIRKAAGVITVGKDHAAWVTKICADVKVHALHDLPPPIRYDEHRLADLKDSLGLNGFKIGVYTGNFASYQGIDLLLESWKVLVRQNDKVKLILVGGTPEQIESYTKKTLHLGIADHVIFAGNKSPEELGDYLMCADTLISPRITGANTPLKIYTYMACGKPIVATNIRSHTQVLSDNEAYLSHPEVHAFAEALAQSFSQTPGNLQIASNRSRAAKRLADEYFNRQRFESILKKAYEFTDPTYNQKEVSGEKNHSEARALASHCARHI
ncbi:MAG: glycosyltransferase [Candidatus Dadabacteria bacterium]|nr:MAG: glycosyltransferase [Candidatus Dadabacteria bacterium]